MPPTLADPAARTFRAGGAYELVVFDRLAPAEQVLLAELRADPDFYGVLRPRARTGRTIRAVDRDTALLWLTLQAPAPLPFFALEGEPEIVRRRVTELVLDGVLEVAVDDGFVSGLAALPPAEGAPDDAPDTRLGRLSHEALRFGQALDLDSPEELSGRLYGYGRAPLTPAWARRLPDRDAVLDFLGAGPGTSMRARLDGAFRRAPEPDATGWFAWTRAGGRASRARGPTYKLYLSPAIEAMPDAVRALVDVLAVRDRAQFKFGADGAGLLRPDKLVAYFDDLASLHTAAGELESRLAGLPAHGVPFSAEVALDGLLSWGMDPPRSERVLEWQGYESWRLWLVRRLAAALVAAQHDAAPGMAPWRYALERLRWDGVDVDRWTPSEALWRAA